MNIDGQTIDRLLDKRGAYPEWCASYGEPGYGPDPEKRIIFADWNHVNKRVYQWLEHNGYALEWCDEWIISHETNKAYRSSPDSYGWQQSYFLTDGGDVIGKDEIEAGDCVDEYLETLLDNPKTCDTFNVDWTKHGFTKMNDDSYESGFHPGQTDDPKEIFAAAKKQFPDAEFLFSLDSTGQFDARFSIWKRIAVED